MNIGKPIQFNQLKDLKEIKDLKKGKVEVSPIVIKHIKLFLFPVVTIIMVISLTWFFLIPQITEIRVSIDENNKNAEVLARLEEKLNKLNEIKNSMVLGEFERLEKVLPSEKNIPQLINTLSMLQRDNEVIYEGLVIKPGIIDSDTVENKPISFGINIGGPTDKVVAYISKLLDTVPLINISSVGLNTKDGYTRGTLSVNSFYYPLPSKLGAVDSPLPEINKSVQESIDKALSLKDPPQLLDIPVEGTPSAETVQKVSIFSL
ncbi:hypothetical protein HYT02_03435 [Candidatus Gottesmanbacteria bacterium]|nr:hypothetical protein [Candidatus Gottesmanbacteria bacterium]